MTDEHSPGGDPTHKIDLVTAVGEVVVSLLRSNRRAEEALEAPAPRRLNRAERKEARARAAAEAELAARIARAHRRLAQAGGVPGPSEYR